MESELKPITRIVLVRHGHVEGIAPERFRGRRDVALSELGVRQAHGTARRVAEQWTPVVTYSSPLKRCLQTAEAIGRASRTPIETLADLNDLNYGDWEWSTHAAALEQWPELYSRWSTTPQLMQFPNGESLQDLASRVARALWLMLERHRQQTVVVVGHNAGNRALLLQLLDQTLSAYWRLEQDPCSLSEIVITDRGPAVKFMNDTHHLREVR
jgi:probable phosphoglycerate mutase